MLEECGNTLIHVLEISTYDFRTLADIQRVQTNVTTTMMSTVDMDNCDLTSPQKVDFCCQTDINDNFCDDAFLFMCQFSENFNEVATQANISSGGPTNLFTHKKDKCVGNEEIINCKGFHGYRSIKDLTDLNSIAGVTLDRFILLLSFVTTVHSKLSTENRLLLFLMNMKLGISNATVGVLFHIHKTTAPRIFLSVFHELVQKGKNLVFLAKYFVDTKYNAQGIQATLSERPSNY